MHEAVAVIASSDLVAWRRGRADDAAFGRRAAVSLTKLHALSTIDTQRRGKTRRHFCVFFRTRKQPRA
jgi:hypothetical protein